MLPPALPCCKNIAETTQAFFVMFYQQGINALADLARCSGLLTSLFTDFCAGIFHSISNVPDSKSLLDSVHCRNQDGLNIDFETQIYIRSCKTSTYSPVFKWRFMNDNGNVFSRYTGVLNQFRIQRFVKISFCLRRTT